MWVRTAKDEAERNKIEFQLKAPPAWEKKPRPTDRQNNAADFMAAMNALPAQQGTGS